MSKVGDEKIVKGEVFVKVFRKYKGALVVSNGRYLTKWVRKNSINPRGER